MNILTQLIQHNLVVTAVHKFKDIFLIFTSDGIYAWGDEKKVKDFMKKSIKA